MERRFPWVTKFQSIEMGLGVVFIPPVEGINTTPLLSSLLMGALVK